MKGNESGRVQETDDRSVRIEELEIINRGILTMSRTDDIDHICVLFGENVHRLVGSDSVVGVSLYDREIGAIRIRFVTGLGPLSDRMLRQFDYKRLRFDPDDMGPESALYTSGKLEKVEGGLYTLLMSKFPKAVCASAEALFGVGEVYTVGFALDGRPYGGITIFLRKKRTLGHRSAIEVLASHFAVTIQQKQAEKALRASESKARSILNASPASIALLDTDRRILDHNDGCAALVHAESGSFAGRPSSVNAEPGRLMGRPLPDMLTGTLAESCTKLHAEALDTNKHVQVRIQHRDRHVEISAHPLAAADGRVYSVVLLLLDITDQVRLQEEKDNLEQQYQQARKMEAVGRLAGGVAHDLNNMLAPILGYAELLSENFREDDEKRNSLEQITSAALKARDLVRQLLAFGRKQPLSIKPTDLNVVLDDIKPLLRRSIREDVHIATNFAPGLPCIRADRSQIEQVLMNLAVNAQESMPSGGTLWIETGLRDRMSCLDTDARCPGCRHDQNSDARVFVSISDTGCGMDEATLSRIFEPFFTTKKEGTGLGLATVFGIVSQHGGSVGVQSEPGSGTTFTCCFPVGDEPCLHPEDRGRMEPADCATGTVMVVEDDDSVRNLIVSVLGGNGYEVLAAESGDACLEMLCSRSEPLHLLLTDVVMPDMNGRLLAEKAAALHPDMKIMFMSGYAEDVIADVTAGHGLFEKNILFLKKPFTVQELTCAVREALVHG
jgi:signal transduction histidine kinase/CheY-like chemotaxis protein